ncbi:DUF4153 domain-containing protein [Serinicoccus kebangsaanensis]|uniref:DUF4153 domain-containing protein n=1 Tax=Serinicoccus kebangsaanensis TaxID=2602069 RepID=UPI00124DF577|nr:DUF4153 domain-containing protein [Serinicoccus kebangsaanensis]
MSPAPEQPLDQVGSITVKIGVLVTLSILAAVVVSEVGDRAGVSAWLTIPVSVAAALFVTQWLARGMTSPLRQMTVATRRMAGGDYSIRVAATSSDEVGQLGSAFNTMSAELEGADRQRRELLATVSHELRTPLAAQRALLENLVDGVVSSDDRALQTALDQSERLSALVQDLLDLSRVEAGVAALDLEPVRVGDLLARCADEARATSAAAGRGVSVEVAVSPEDLEVSADRARLAQVVTNLLDNALRHSPEGGTVRVVADGAGGESWTLEVGDEGPGFPPGRSEQLFARFGVGDDASGGTGLGLSIVRWVCELHGGAVAAVEDAEASSQDQGLATPSPGAGHTSAAGAVVRAVLPRSPATARIRPLETSPWQTNQQSNSGSPRIRPLETPPWQTNEQSNSGDAPRPTPKQAQESAMTTETPPPPTPAQPSPPPTPAHPIPVPTPSIFDTLFGRFWPEPTSRLRTAPVALWASIAVGAAAAILLPYRGIGLSYLAVLLLGGALVLHLSARRRDPWTVVSTVLCLGLASLLVLRAAEWLSVLALLTAAVLVTTALTGARGLPAMVAGAASWVASGLRGLPLLGRTITATSRHTLLWPVLRTAAISLVALVIFGGLFASGDAVVGAWVSDLLPDVSIAESLVLRSFTWFVVGGIVLAGCYLALNPPRVDLVALPEPRRVTRTWEWLVPVGVVIATFVVFLLAQGAALFGGHDYVQRTTGMTYAESVHQGFGQLTLATALTLVTVAIASRRAPQESDRERLLVRAALGALCVLTLVVVGSALYRMHVYQQAYGFTVLRVLVDAFELWLGLLIVLVLVAGVRMRGRWLPRAALASGAAMLLVIGLGNPEAWVAQRNIERYERTGELDLAYLQSLGADAVPTIRAGLEGETVPGLADGDDLADCAVGWAPDEELAEDALSWNLGRDRAVAAGPQSLTPVDGYSYPTLALGDCPVELSP